jgi:phospholipase C
VLEGADANGAIDLKYYDTAGVRAMGYYDWIDLPFYYFMASNCVTSDNWFSPVLDRTQLNRMYLFAATSQGYVYPPGTDAQDNAPLTAPMIFDSLQKAGVSWKVYETDPSQHLSDPICRTRFAKSPAAESCARQRVLDGCERRNAAFGVSH